MRSVRPETIGGRPKRRASRLTWFLVALVLLSAAAVTLAVPASARAADYPRLGLVWPYSSESDASLARYDYVVLGGAEKARIPRIKALHPDEILLTTDNGCEVSLGAIKGLPAGWLLTQVGSVLTAAVDATTKTLPVSATTASGKTLYGVGDLVVIENEVARVEALTATSLTVQRGAYRPATSHPAGARVAATITYWSGTVVMDMSTYCPRVTVDTAVGPETWAEYHGRTSAARVSDAAWDGIYIDRIDGDESWLVTSTFTHTAGRTIDPNRSNRVVTDGYAAFDAAWNAGLRVYEQKVRSLIGPSKIILGNGAWPNYDLLNGTLFEGFPDAEGGIMAIGWRDAMFTPDVSWGVTGKGSYTQWASAALQPNLTSAVTYQADHGGADGKTPDYRNLRFALTTALMGDGYSVYQLHGTDRWAINWFDEYDGGGLGTGYLGQPTGAAYPVGAAWRRDYSGGAALVNPSSRPVTVRLGRTYRKIHGTQAPAVNDGSLVSAVTILAKDGIVLLSTSGIDASSPSMALASPLDGSVVSGLLNIAVLAADDVGVSKVEFRVDGTLLATYSSAPYAAIWDASSASVGLESQM